MNCGLSLNLITSSNRKKKKHRKPNPLKHTKSTKFLEAPELKRSFYEKNSVSIPKLQDVKDFACTLNLLHTAYAFLTLLAPYKIGQQSS